MSVKTYIMLHHSLTKDGDTVSWGAIEDYHKNEQGWKDIGYHFGVERINGRLYALLGRGETEEAAACKEGLMNMRAVHVCIVGNFDLAPPDDETLEFLCRRVLRPLMNRHSITFDHIVRHSDYATYKSCPGTQFDVSRLKKWLS